MKTEIIKFHEDELVAFKEDDRVFVSVVHIAKAIGLSAQSALRGIKNDEILRDECTQRYGHDAINRKVLMHVVPIEYLNGWLFSIQYNQVKAEVKPKLLLYKKECYRVLYEYFNGSYRQLRENMTNRVFHHNRLMKVQRIIKHLKKEEKRQQKIIDSIDRSNYSQFELFPEELKLIS